VFGKYPQEVQTEEKKNSSHHKWQLNWPLVHANQRRSCSHQTDCFKAHRVSDEISFSAAWFLT